MFGHDSFFHFWIGNIEETVMKIKEDLGWLNELIKVSFLCLNIKKDESNGYWQ